MWSLLFHLQNSFSVFWNFNVELPFLGKRSSCPWNQPHLLWNLIKSFYFPREKTKRNSRNDFRRTAEDDDAKINVSLNIHCTFLLFKASAFLQFFWWEKRFLSFAPRDKWNISNSIEQVKVYFSIAFYNEDWVLQ